MEGRDYVDEGVWRPSWTMSEIMDFGVLLPNLESWFCHHLCDPGEFITSKIEIIVVEV